MEILSDIGNWAWSWVWTPTLIWTGVMLVLMTLLKIIPTRYPQIHLDLNLAGLGALGLGILVSAVIALSPGAQIPVIYIASPIPGTTLSTLPNLTNSPVVTTGFGWAHAVGIMTLVALLLSLVGVSRLISGGRRLAAVLSGATPIDGVRFPEVQVVQSRQITVPFSAGLIRKWVVLPFSMGASDRRTVLAHEISHHKNGDVIRAWIAQITRALFFFHPLVHALHKRCMLLTEIVCDQHMIRVFNLESKSYANMLMRHAPVSSVAEHTLALVHSPSQLKKRIEAMKTSTLLPFSQTRFLSIGVAALLCIGMLVGCMDIEPGITEPDVMDDAYDLVMELPSANMSIDQEPFVIVERSPILLGGLKGLQADLRYPEIAKRAGVEGRVYLQFIVDETGKVRDPMVTRGIGAGCDEEALRAIESVLFVPGVQRGVRVPVKMSIPITFRLDENDEPDLSIGSARPAATRPPPPPPSDS